MADTTPAPSLVIPEAKTEPTKFWRLSVVFGPQATIWAFLYKTETAASTARFSLMQSPTGPFRIADDFGQDGEFPDKPHGAMLDDMSLSGMAGNLIQLQNARNQARMNDLVLKDTDPELQKAIKAGRTAALQHQFSHGMPPGPFPRA